jgi:3-deoxy-manno-octulosonate cytidylyltransferase (CMP-KDO synthetase)
MILGLIPARLQSKRLPNKPLVKVGKLPLLVHVYRRAMLSKKLDDVIICADDIKIKKAMDHYNIKCILTPKNCKNGTERIAHYIKKIKKKIKLVVDIQCDEIFLNPNDVDRLINFHLKNFNNFDIVIPHSLTNEKNNTNYCKIVSNQNNKILYLTRADASYNYHNKKNLIFKRHLDFISLKPNVLKNFSLLKNRNLEQCENIELLRALDNNYSLGTFFVKDDIFSINTTTDLKNAKKKIKNNKLYKKIINDK